MIVYKQEDWEYIKNKPYIIRYLKAYRDNSVSLPIDYDCFDSWYNEVFKIMRKKK